MIIVDPDTLVAPCLTHNDLTEAPIGLDVRLPLGLVIPHLRLHKMQQGPEGTVTHAVIIALDVLSAQEHRHTAIRIPELALEALPGRC